MSAPSGPPTMKPIAEPVIVSIAFVRSSRNALFCCPASGLNPWSTMLIPRPSVAPINAPAGPPTKNPMTAPPMVVIAAVRRSNQLETLFSEPALKSNASVSKESPRPILAPISAPPTPPTINPMTPPASALRTYCNPCAISLGSSTPSWSKMNVSAIRLNPSPISDPTNAPGTPPRINPTPAPVSINRPESAFSAICSPVRSDQSNRTSDTVILKSAAKSWSACATGVSSNIAE